MNVSVDEGLICCEDRMPVTKRQVDLFSFLLQRRESNKSLPDDRRFASEFRSKSILRRQKRSYLTVTYRAHKV